MAKINSTIFKQETIQSWFSGVGTSIDNEVIQPFQNAEQVIWKYNQAIQHNSLTQQGWERLLAQSDDSLKAYLTSIKGSTASMTGYNVSLQGNVTGFKKVSSAITQYNAISASGAVEQNTFATAVSTTNSRLGTYLTGLNGANASLGGYIISLVGATAKTVALKVATIALNSAVTMGASLIISGIVSAISEWINKTENMIEASEEAIEKIKSINDELKNNQKTISDTAKRYAELAQGVDQLTGKNISLTSEDYEEFLSLSNQLAEMFPTLTRNYNDNGDAIVQLSGDVDTIVGSLQNLIEAQRDLANRQIVDELPTVFEGIAAKSNEYEQELSNLESKRDALIKSLGDVQSEEFSSNFMDGFTNKLIEISGDNLEVISQMKDDYIKILKDANINYEELTPTYEMKDGVEVPVGFTIKINSSDDEVEKVKNTIDGKIEDLAETYTKDIEKLYEEINTTNEKNKTNWTSLSNSIYAWLSTDDSFKVMDDTMQATVQNIVNSLDWGSLDFSSWEDAKQYIQDNILSLFNTTDGKEVLADIQVMFGIQTQFNNGDITVEQYQAKLQEFLASIENLPPESKKSIMLLFGIETNEDGTTTSDVDTMLANVEKKLQDKFDDKVGKLTLEDLKIASELEIPDGTLLSWDELLERIQKVKDEISSNKIDDLSLETLSKQLDDIQSAYNSVASDIEEYNEKGYISVDTFQSLMELSPEYLRYLTDEEGHLRLGTDAMNDYTSALIDNMAKKQMQSIVDYVSNLSDEERQLYLTKTATDEASASLLDFAASTITAKFASNELSQEEFISLQKMLNNVANWAESAKSGLNKGGLGNNNSYTSNFKSILDKHLKIYETELELGLIDFENFTDKSFALVEKFYREGKISAEEYWDSINQLYEKQLAIYDKVISAVTRRIDKEIEGIEDIIDGLEDQNDALEKQLDDYDGILSAVEEVYDKEIERLEDEKDLLQDKIDALNDEADAYELVRKKEEALYALEQAQKNRTKKIYVEGQGYIYDKDHKAIRDAQDDLQDIETEEAISKLEKEQDVIDESIDILEEYKQKWLEISEVYEKETNKQLAIALWGEDYESMILQNRISDIDTFKNNYIGIQKQVDDNQSLIDSYNEKVEYYQKLKDQWTDIAEAYEQSVDEQYASMILGRDWEHQILDERSTKLEEFKTTYVTLQETMAQAAMDSANKQAEAAKIASDAATTLAASKLLFDDVTESNSTSENPQKFRVVRTSDGSVVSDGYTDSFEAYKYIAKQELFDPIKGKYKVEAYSTGGLIGKKKSPLDVIAKQVGEDKIIAVKEGERVLTPVQNEIWEKAIPNLQEFAKTINFMPNIKMPDYSHLSSMIQRQPIQQNNVFNITMPNVTNSTSADRIMRDLQRLPLDAYQYSRKR